MTAIGRTSPLLEPILGLGGDERIALCATDASVSYGQLRRDTALICDALRRHGIGSGDRVGICLPKRISTVETILGILAAGATYVPLNPRLPPAQLLRLLSDLRPSMVIASPQTAHALREAHAEASAGFGLRLAAIAARNGAVELDLTDIIPGEAVAGSSADAAVILYTSGTTGEPKGIMLSHENLKSFVDWAAATFEISEADRLTSHAPLYFDLSIFDIFCGLSRRASVHLIDETAAQFPGAIRNLVASAGITVWYSVPTALVRLQERQALKGIASLRLILFAGEIFPVPILRQLMADVPAPEYVNLYGPTETNVCTYHRLPGPPDSDLDELPIGRACEHLEVHILDSEGHPVRPGETGELCVTGPAVMRGYWRRPEATAATRLRDRADSYLTGDYGCLRSDGVLMFGGRRDQQIKVRGYRVELLALQAALNAHPHIREAAVVFIPQTRRGGAVAAFLVAKGPRPTSGEIRAFVADRLPPQYQPDYVEWVPELPLTPTGKCDRARLISDAKLAAEA
jgi:amino acid adenylation domain-containing protein